jgi:hypothetical protein
MTNRLAAMTDKSDNRDQWQAFNPTHLPGLEIATPPNLKANFVYCFKLIFKIL